MATSPSPFPFCTGPPTFPSSFTTAATYHHPFLFGFSPAYAPGSVFPPPPCAFGATAPGFFPAPAYAPAPTMPSPYSQICVPLPESTGPPTTAPPATYSSSSPTQNTFGRSIASTTTSSASNSNSARPSPLPPAGMPATALPLRPERVAGHHLLAESSSPTFLTTASKMQPESMTPGQPEDTHYQQPCEFLNKQARLDQQQAFDRTSFDTIQGQLTKLTSMVSQFAVSLGKQSTSAPASKPEQSQHISIVPAAPAHVAPQVLDEMPTPSSLKGTHGTAPPPHCCSRHNNLIQSPCVSNLSGQNLDEGSRQYDFQNLNIQSGFSNLSEKNLEMPQSYGFSNLDRQTVCLADGTEHIYFALPADYPLEQAVPKQVFALYEDRTEGRTEGDSNEYVDVFATTPEQQPYEEAQHGSEQHPKCFSRPSEHPLHEVISELTLTDNVDVPVARSIKFIHGPCIPQVLQYVYAPGCAMGDVLKDYKWNMLVSEGGREVWDPGASGFLVTPLKNHIFSYDKADLWSQYEHQFIVLRGVFVEVMLDKPPAKPPDRFGIAESSLQVFLLKEAQKSEHSSAHTNFNFLICNSKQFSAVQARQDICFLLEAISSWKEGAFSLGNFAVSALWRNTTQVEDKIFGRLHTVVNSQNLFSGLSRGDTENICIFVKLSPCSIFSAQHIPDSSMKKGIIFSSGHTLAENPWSAILFLHYFSWEFSMDRVLSKTPVPHLVHRSEIPIKLLIFIEQPIALKHYMSQLSLQCHSWSHTQNAFCKVQYCSLPIVLDCLYSEPVKQLGYSSLFSSTEMCRSTTTVLMKLVLNSGEVAQEGRDKAAVYQVSKIQLPMRKISHVWDPGIESILVFYKGQHMQMIQLVHCSAIHSCYFVPAPTKITAYCFYLLDMVKEL